MRPLMENPWFVAGAIAVVVGLVVLMVWVTQ